MSREIGGDLGYEWRYLRRSTVKYPDGRETRLGDRVKLGQDDGGVVVASIDTNEYGSEHSKAQWGYLKKGKGLSTVT